MKKMVAMRALLVLLAVCLLSSCVSFEISFSPEVQWQDLPSAEGETYRVLQDNQPNFAAEDLVAESYEYYSPLDSLGRCGPAVACIGRDLMPTKDRESIGQVKPSGWKTAKYDFVDGKYLYNRCHLIGFQLTGENANERNLITGTRYFNVEGMLPFENMVADYVKETENHVLYRVTPVFEGNELVARGVVMEAKSVEDGGEGICFHVLVYNFQPGVTIDYATGESDASEEESSAPTGDADYILNTSSKKFHRSSCKLTGDIKEKNKAFSKENRETLIRQGYEPCKNCNP